jgi:hypothetical protein
MRKVVLTYGILAGFIVAVLMVAFGMGSNESGDFSTSMLLGYASMLISLSMIFFGIRNYRDNFSGGSLTFGNALVVGLYITIIASILYAITWKLYSSIALPDFADQYAKQMIHSVKASGASDSVIAVETKKMADWKQMYANPFFELGMTFLEIFPVGFLISLICAAILKRKPKAEVIAP